MHFTWKHIVVCGIALASALFSVPSLAVFPTCSLLGTTTFTPAHPQGADPITFGVNFFRVLPPEDAVLIKTTFVTSNQIMFDVVATPPGNIAMFPGYQAEPVNSELISGNLGTLASGQYAVTTSVHIYDPATGLSTPCQDQTASLVVYTDDGLSSVIEYYNSKLDHYFNTQDATEIAALDSGVFPGWARTGETFLAYRPDQGAGAGQPIYRYYGLPSAGLDTHFFTNNLADIFYLTVGQAASEWELETRDAFDLNNPVMSGEGIGDCKAEEVPVYRLWNGRSDSDHRYTTDPAIKALMVAKGYIAEGYGPNAVMNCAFTR